MSNLVATGTRLGIRCALHENYVDYYPNYDFYNTNDIALDSAGHLQLAWYNPGTHIQSFAVKPDAILRLAATQSPEIHRRYNTQADYLDVHSAVPPWFHVDDRAGRNRGRASSAGFGTFTGNSGLTNATRTPARSLGKATIIGTGAGALTAWKPSSGAAGPATAASPRLWPWISTCSRFIHSSSTTAWVTTAVGGPANLTKPIGLDPSPMVVLDRYRMQEVAYGHAGFLDASIYANPPLAWLEHHLLSPVMARYAMARPQEILYETRGAWIDATAVGKLDRRRRMEPRSGSVRKRPGVDRQRRFQHLAVGSWVLPDLGLGGRGRLASLPARPARWRD